MTDEIIDKFKNDAIFHRLTTVLVKVVKQKD